MEKTVPAFGDAKPIAPQFACATSSWAALARASTRTKVALATSPDDDYFYVWREDSWGLTRLNPGAMLGMKSLI